MYLALEGRDRKSVWFVLWYDVQSELIDDVMRQKYGK
jgi:hypothetical protein